MKSTDGLFHQVFDELAAEYPEIQSDHQIIDIGAARLAAQPEMFGVIVTLNLYGDILSDIASQIAGSVGLAGSANIGHTMAMFEAVHRSAPDIAGKDVANPSGLLTAGTQMLVHLGLGSYGEAIKNAWLCTLEDGIHTADIYRQGLSQEEVGTRRFTEAIIERLGRKPDKLQPVAYLDRPIRVTRPASKKQTQQLRGVDVFLNWDERNRDPNVLGERLEGEALADFELVVITNRGVKVYPDGISETFCTDHWRCRFVAKNDSCDYAAVLQLMTRINNAGLEIIKTENLYDFDGQAAYSLAQGH